MRKLIDVDTVNQQVIDLSGNGTPLETADCLAFTVFADSIEAGRNEFILPQSLFVSNQQHNINAIYVDFSDGQGFIQVSPDIPVTVYYDKTGNTTITMHAVIDSQNYYATTEIKINIIPASNTAKAKMIIDEVPCGGYEKFPLYFLQKSIFLCMIENFMLSLQKI
jgi:PKD repeat protein